ncbi:hypothetical protein [Natronolimnobius baerhuensis]|uniref:Uncharacterized protein n=1 Tax=Natronolimnobius baerhuensis TaxID=253108 RepID=A0A202E5W1_9EURY|nr:hypothetical protein [Natronolimnobius baerhuensis]OVE83290.1 hypothetical protein B2G88_17370 [Natronolimnobius baerhuensis]
MTDRGFDVRWRGVDGRARKLAFEPADGGHMRIEYVRCAGRWKPVGREPVEDVGLETADGVVEGR